MEHAAQTEQTGQAQQTEPAVPVAGPEAAAGWDGPDAGWTGGPRAGKARADGGGGAGGGDLVFRLPRPVTRTQLIALDALAAVGLVSLLPSVATTASAPGGAGPGGVPRWAAVGLSVLATLPIAVRRIWPRPVFALVLTATLAGVVAGVARNPFIAAAYALYPVALTAPPRRRGRTFTLGLVSLGLLAVIAPLVVGVAPTSPVPDGMRAALPSGWVDELGLVLFGAAVMGGTWTVGRAVAERRAATARAAEQLAARAVTEERLRIARELHDIVAHSMSLIAVKAGVANHVLTVRPEEAHDALRIIETTSRSALTEMRHLLGVLRAEPTGPLDAEPAAGGSSGLAAAEPPLEPPLGPGALGPAPGLAGLRALTERAALAGVQADLEVDLAGPLPEGVEVSVYRIVQEALTNVVKHAAPARCQVRVHARGGQVRVQVTDDGGAAAAAGGPSPRGRPRGHGSHRPAGGGHGLIGMRERVAMYGGRVAAGPRPDGGFAVSASLPYQPIPPERAAGGEPV